MNFKRKLKNWKKLFSTCSHPPVILIRGMIGVVFLIAGLQKFIFPGEMGPGRFEEMGYAYPAFTAYAVGFFEAGGGVLILLGLATRLAAVPIAVIMSVAIITTKIPRLEAGIWDFLHGSRLDFAMLMGALFLIWSGADRLSLDARLGKRKRAGFS
ncbi:MAG: DoxX family protein [Verrucomicrobia bacterium]|nr:DoxX family protein [Verrucomicrobiota bacterium]MCH8513441.1 DoxX family protein [Kiritimatiellia bacterium]